jgi:hypothetical protein
VEAAASAAAPVAAAAVEDEDDEEEAEEDEGGGPRLELCTESVWSQCSRPRAAATRTARSATCEERDDRDHEAAALVARLAVDVPDVDAPPDGVHVVKTLIKDEQVTEAPEAAEAAAVPAPDVKGAQEPALPAPPSMPAPPPTSPPPSTHTTDECSICFEAGPRALLSCGHARCCLACSRGALAKTGTCPICRAPAVVVVERVLV